jgi:tetratricopeptide (TPR) repeat protein
LAAIAYSNAGHERFEFDSAGTQIVNAQTRDLPGSVRRLISAPLAGDGRLSALSFSLTCKLNEAIGKDPFHVNTFLFVNVVIHATNGWLVFLLIRALQTRAGPRRRPSMGLPLALACVFVVHPILASSVAYIVQRRGALATTFYILGVLSFLRARDPRPAPHRWAWIGVTLACCWLSFQSKSMAMTFPVMLLAVEFALRAVDRQALKRILRMCALAIPLCALGMLLFLWTHGYFDLRTLRTGGTGQTLLWSPWVHLLTESRVFLHFWKLLLLPLPQWSAIDHRVSLSASLWEPVTLAAVFAHLAILASAVFAALRGWTLAAIGIFWFYIALIPYTILAQPELLVEYKTYLPAVGVTLFAAGVLERIPGASMLPIRVLSARGPALAAACAVIVALLATTLHRNAIYRDPILMWTDAAEKNPGYARPRLNIGMVLIERDRREEAMAYLEEVLRICDDYRRRVEKGDVLFQEAPRIDMNLAGAHISLGIIHKLNRRLDQAETHLEEGIRWAPFLPEGYLNLATVRLIRGKPDQAIESLRAGLSINSNYPDAQLLLAQALEVSGRIEESRAAYLETLRQVPGHAEALQGLERLSRPTTRPS